MSDKRASEATRAMLDCAQAVAEQLNPRDPDGALRALADLIQQNNAEPRLAETYPADWPKLRVVYVGLLAQGQTRQVRDRRRETLSLALGNPEDFQYGLLKKLSDFFAVTSYEAIHARLHCLEHGPGMPTPPFSYARQGLPANATKFLSEFSVNDAVVLKMPGRATGETADRFKRYHSLTGGYGLLEQMRAEHNETFPNDQIRKISYGKYVEAMSDKGYSRMRCYTGVCECCHSNGHVNWESLLTLFSDVRIAFIELKAPETIWPEHLEQTLAEFTARIRELRNYYKDQFKSHLSRDTTEASHNIQLALSHPDNLSPFHVNLNNMQWVQECKHCADRHFVIGDVKACISALRSFVQPAESDAPNEAESAALLAGVQMAEGLASNPAPKKPQAAPTPAVSLEQLGSLLARLEVIDKRISKLIGHHFRDVNAELYQVLKKAGLLDDEVSADFGEPSS
jgi:hypothetical protein